MGLLALGLVLVAWCLLHSVLAMERTKKVARRWIQPAGYRFLYTVFSVVSLMPVALIYLRIDDDYLLKYGHPYNVFVGALFFFSSAVLLYSFTYFDAKGFLGLKAETEKLVTTGIYGYSRHPMYTCSIIMLWARNLKEKDIPVNLIFSTYLIVGAFIEERRLIARYAEVYRAYMKKTSMFLPLGSGPRKAGGC